MARVKRAVPGKGRRKKVLKAAKGYYGARSRQLRTAKTTVMRSGVGFPAFAASLVALVVAG